MQSLTQEEGEGVLICKLPSVALIELFLDEQGTWKLSRIVAESKTSMFLLPNSFQGVSDSDISPLECILANLFKKSNKPFHDLYQIISILLFDAFFLKFYQFSLTLLSTFLSALRLKSYHEQLHNISFIKITHTFISLESEVLLVHYWKPPFDSCGDIDTGNFF